MVKISTLLFSLACACALIQSATPTATQDDSPIPVESRRMLKGGGGGGGHGGGGHGGTSGGRPSSGGRPTSGGGGVIVGSSVAAGAYVGSHPSHHTSTGTSNSGSRGNNQTDSGDIIFPGDGGSVPASAATDSAATRSTSVAAVIVLVIANAL